MVSGTVVHLPPSRGESGKYTTRPGGYQGVVPNIPKVPPGPTVITQHPTLSRP
jgi:hypothetical protein